MGGDLMEIKDYGNLKISSYGFVISPQKGINYGNDNGKGYKNVNITINGIHKRMYIHRLVAMLFIPNPENKPQVNHIDGNKWNNNVSNLEWCTRSENIQHAFNTGLFNNRQLIEVNSEPCEILIKESGKTVVFPSMKVASVELGHNKSYFAHLYNRDKGENKKYKIKKVVI